MTGSRQVSWAPVHEFLQAALAPGGRRWCHSPCAGTPAWCELADGDPRKLLSLAVAGEHHVLRVEVAQTARAEASQAVAAAADWPQVSREIRQRKSFREHRLLDEASGWPMSQDVDRSDELLEWYGEDNPDGPQLFDDLRDFLARFVVYPSEHTLNAHVLWIAHAWLMDAWESTPRIAFLSPEPGSGKSRALEVTEPLVPRPIHAVNCTPATCFARCPIRTGNRPSSTTSATRCSGRKPRTTKTSAA